MGPVNKGRIALIGPVLDVVPIGALIHTRPHLASSLWPILTSLTQKQ